ncbi:unnamed protein product [Darwinula stevensoni]|uniref:t-SNARE coiled-coil homology domain-containing protein n=1 Tax=Darwinula stevensoni TaxID=69355 RepID=A0A7R9AG41_9CRUS|nr:unnamed protein product [Darwinula stevensoni]CAG0903028.1 unnamed protein product [Darwinula stevensoni]
MRRVYGYPSTGRELQDSEYPQPRRRDHLEDENDHLTEGLKEKIGALKSVSLEIGVELKEHNRLLSEMDDDFEKSHGILRKTMTRVVQMAKAGHNRYLLYLFLFSLFVFFVIWLLIKFR